MIGNAHTLLVWIIAAFGFAGLIAMMIAAYPRPEEGNLAARPVEIAASVFGVLTSRPFVLIVAGIIVLSLIGMARAHDENGDPNWITRGAYVGPDNVHCCGPRDCERVDPQTIQATPQGYVLKGFADELVPYSSATPSEDKSYWRCHDAYGKRRCFFAPFGGS